MHDRTFLGTKEGLPSDRRPFFFHVPIIAYG